MEKKKRGKKKRCGVRWTPPPMEKTKRKKRKKEEKKEVPSIELTNFDWIV